MTQKDREVVMQTPADPLQAGKYVQTTNIDRAQRPLTLMGVGIIEAKNVDSIDEFVGPKVNSAKFLGW
jgi:hypothetical protein